MLLFKFASLLIIIFIATVIISLNREELKYAYFSEYEIINDDASYLGNAQIEIFIHGNQYEENSMTREVNHEGKQLTSEITLKGTLQKHDDNEYHIEVESKETIFSNLKEKYKFIKSPITKTITSAERYLPHRNPVHVISSEKDFIIVTSFINGGQVLALKRY